MNRRGGRLLLAGAVVGATVIVVPAGVAAAAPGVSAISAQAPTASNSGNGNNGNGNNGNGNSTWHVPSDGRCDWSGYTACSVSKCRPHAT